MRVLRRREPVLVELPDDDRAPRVQDVDGTVGPETLFLVPLVPGRRANGLLVATWDRPRRLASDDRAIVEALAGQAAQALERARAFESEQTIAETLAAERAARVAPARRGRPARRSVPPRDGAARRGRRLVRRAPAARRQARPRRRRRRRKGRAGGREHGAVAQRDSRVLDRAPEASVGAHTAQPARRRGARHVVRDGRVLALDPAKGICRMSSAGHPPPVVAYPDGSVALLEQARGLPLGTGIPTKYRQETIELPAGTVLVLYTDGLVERRGRSIDDGLRDLQVAIARRTEGPRSAPRAHPRSGRRDGRARRRHRTPRGAPASGRAAAARIAARGPPRVDGPRP